MILVPILGCGLDEYNTRASRTHERLRSFDNEDALLGEPVQLPRAAVPVYLRLPREVSLIALGQESIPGLAHFPCQDSADRLPVLEAHVGFIPLREVEVSDVLLDRLTDYIQSYSGCILESVSDAKPSIEVQREWESPQLLQANWPIRYRQFAWLARKEDPRDSRGQALRLPAGFTAVFRYELYLRHIEADEQVSEAGHVVVVFRQLDAEQTTKRWEELLASEKEATNRSKPSDPGQPVENNKPEQADTGTSSGLSKPTENTPTTKPTSQPGPVLSRDVLRWLPQVNHDHLHRAKLAALASLRVGEAARQRLQCYGR